MKVTIVVGGTQIRVVGLDLTPRQVRRLLMDVAGIHATITPDEPEEKQPIGFAAHVERAPDPAPESYFTDDTD